MFDIDIIIPCYGPSDLINRGVASIATQWKREFIHVTLVDDCSPNTDCHYQDLVDKYKDSIDIRSIVMPENSGQGLTRQFGIDNTVYYAEMNWTLLMKATKKNEITFTEVPKFPAVSRDLALLVDNGVEFAQIEQIARQSEKKLLKRVELFDVYEGNKLPAGKKSYAVNFILQDEEKTMGDKQIDAIMQKLIANLKKQLNAELR